MVLGALIFRMIGGIRFMLFGMLHERNAAKPLLTVRARLYDGSELSVHVEDTELVFKTALGISRIALRNVERMENVSKVVTLRKFLWASKFEIHCRDGAKLFGVPRSPAVIHFRDPSAPHTRGDIKLWEIDWLEVQTNHHKTQVFPLPLE